MSPSTVQLSVDFVYLGGNTTLNQQIESSYYQKLAFFRRIYEQAGLMMRNKVMLYIAAAGRPTGQPAFANSHGLDSTGLRRGALVVVLNIDVGGLSDRRCKEVVAVVRVALPNCGRNCLGMLALTPRKLWTRQC